MPAELASGSGEHLTCTNPASANLEGIIWRLQETRGSLCGVQRMDCEMFNLSSSQWIGFTDTIRSDGKSRFYLFIT